MRQRSLRCEGRLFLINMMVFSEKEPICRDPIYFGLVPNHFERGDSWWFVGPRLHRWPPSVLSVMCSTHCSGGHCRGKGCPNLTGLTERWSTFKDRSDIPVKWPTWNIQHTGSLLGYSSFFVSIRGIHPPPEHGWDLCMWSLRLPWGSFNIRFAFLRHKCKGYKLQRRGQE